MKPVLAFDVNETLLDLGPMHRALSGAFGDTAAAREWFLTLLHASLVSNHIGRYESFASLGVNALVTVAQRRSIDLDVDDVESLLAPMSQLPPHPDVPEGLQRLAELGYRLIALTNTPSVRLGPLLEQAGIAEFFELQLSVDEVRRFKPAPEVYLMASTRVGVEVSDMRMVAAHDWDILGARSVGMPGVFIARRGAIWGSALQMPDTVVSDLNELADELAAT